MRCFIATFVLSLLHGAALGAAEDPFHIFILSGQSNMARLKPSESFTPAVEQRFGKGHCAVIHHAASGKAIRWWYRDWKPDPAWTPAKPTDSLAVTEDYSRELVRQYQAAARGHQVSTVTLVWMQGESDGLERHGAVYEQSLTGFVAQLARDVQRSDLQVVLGRISDYGTVRHMADWDVVRAAQVHVAQGSSHYRWVDTDDLNDGVVINGQPVPNDLHYTPEAYHILGARFAEKAIELVTAASHAAAPPH